MDAKAEQNPMIRWPSHYDPAQAAVHVRNELHIAAAPATVWAWLVRAPRWPQWYINARNVRALRGSPDQLAPGSRFAWTTFGVRITSEVQEFVPEERLAWDAKSLGVDAYHAWLLTPDANGGCTVLTEETQHGFVARGSAWLFPTRMQRFHQIWLESLRARALSGLPPA
ncbi:MAG: hypothetical protein JWR16_1113 [Nevskia sp.]|nr:hypothetical protein [Nevskia sp.]